MKLHSFPIFFIAIASLIVSGCYKNSYRVMDGVIWNTTYHIVYDGPASLQDSVISILDSVGKSLNYFDPKSNLSTVNNSSDSVKTDMHFRNVYRTAMKINIASNGMFDPTLSPLINAWGFGKNHKPTSDTLHLDSLLRLTGISQTHLKGEYLYKSNPKITFNFSAIAKGYGCDCVANMLRRNGVTNYMIEIGGEICTSGTNPTHSDWHISIDAPIIDSLNINNDSQAIIAISNRGMATSGNYRNFHTLNGENLGHTISPLTGRPVATDILSATVIAEDAMTADALGTAAMAIGSEKALKLCSKFNAEIYMILPDKTISSPGFNSLIIEQ